LLLRTLDEVTEAGCLFLLITGGEPLLKRNFTEVYRRAKLNGIFVTVFTNGTLVDDRILDLFEELPPLVVEVSLYGATAETFERITRVPGSFKKCVKGIERLVARGLKVRLKTPLMTLNEDEFDQIERLARETYELDFRFDVSLLPTFGGDRDPVTLRVPEEKSVAKQFATEERRVGWKNYLRGLEPNNGFERLYQCAAGSNSFHIDAYGRLTACMLLKEPAHDLRASGFLDGWTNVLTAVREQTAAPGFPCRRCRLRNLCNYCPAAFQLEEQSGKPPEHYCTLARTRYEYIKSLHLMEM